MGLYKCDVANNLISRLKLISKDEHGGGAQKCVASENRSREQGVTMTTLLVATIGRCHTANQWNLEYLPYTNQREGREGAKQTNKHKAM